MTNQKKGTALTETLANNLNQIMKERGISQRKLAEMIFQRTGTKLTHAALGRYQKGTLTAPNLTVIELIAAALNVPITKLLEERNNKLWTLEQLEKAAVKLGENLEQEQTLHTQLEAITGEQPHLLAEWADAYSRNCGYPTKQKFNGTRSLTILVYKHRNNEGMPIAALNPLATRKKIDGNVLSDQLPSDDATFGVEALHISEKGAVSKSGIEGAWKMGGVFIQSPFQHLADWCNETIRGMDKRFQIIERKQITGISYTEFVDEWFAYYYSPTAREEMENRYISPYEQWFPNIWCGNPDPNVTYDESMGLGENPSRTAEYVWDTWNNYYTRMELLGIETDHDD